MDEQLCMLGFGLALSEKVEKAIATFQHYEAEALRRDPVNGYYVCDSFGKDSCVIRHLAKASGVKHQCHHNLTTIDPPELIYFGRDNHQDTIVHRPDIPMLVKLLDKSNGPPTRLSRWCCEIYKEGAGNDKIKVFGVRAAESARRKARWKVWTPWRPNANPSVVDSWVLNPILYWTDEDLWKYIRQENIPYCCLYDEGFQRLGCVGCPMSCRRHQDFVRWPGYERAWKRAFEKFWNKWHGVPRRDGKARWFDIERPSGITFTCWQDLWQWWMEELPEPDDDDCQMGLF